MPQFAANLSMMYPELPFLDRFEAAAKDGFKAVEFLFPYAYTPEELAARIKANHLQQVLFNAPPGGIDPSSIDQAWNSNTRGTASIPGREKEFQQGVEMALRYAEALHCPRIHVMAGLLGVGHTHASNHATYVNNLKWAAALAVKQGLDVLIEPINTRDIPGFYLNRQDQAHNIIEEKHVRLDGKIFGLGQDPTNPSGGNYVNNLALKGASIEVFEIDPRTGKRMGNAVHQKTITNEGTWGPFQGQSSTRYEFVVTATGYATTHFYRSPFPRSSQIIHMRPERMADADKAAQAVVTLTRPRGYFDADRDTMVFDGKSELPGITKGTGAGNSNVRLRLSESTQRSISAEFNGEKLIGQTWPAAQGHTTVLELTY